MRTIQAGSFKLVLYDSIHNLPPHRESLMNYYLTTELGIGHSFETFDSHLSSIIQYALENDGVSAHQELENLRLNYWSILQQYNPKHLSWICLIESINDEPLRDMEETNLMRLSNELSESCGNEYVWEQIFEELKKKLPTSWQTAFRKSNQIPDWE